MTAPSALDRRAFLGAASAALASLALEARPAGRAEPLPPLEEVSAEALQEGLGQGRWTSVALASAYLRRIRGLDPKIRAVAEVNPDALQLAAALDAERRRGQVRGPLHGLPILVKDNLDTADRMKTTAGSLALVDAPVPKADAFVVARLRAAGVLLLGKANLSEWANFRGSRSVSGWSGRGGQVRNPHALDRNPSGSSSGSAAAVAAGLCAAAVGTETDGSIVSPASCCGIVGLKPTVGCVSRSGIIPISATQDTAGPMARTVRDAALLLAAMAGPDPADPATAGAPARDLLAQMAARGLAGARLGWVKHLGGQHRGVDRVMAAAQQVLKAQGAVLVEVELSASAYEAAEFEVLLYEFRAGIEAYLAVRGGKLRTLADLIAFNEREGRELAPFGQELFLQAQAKGPLTDPAYLKAREACGAARKGIEALLEEHRLEALVGPTGAPAWLTDPVNGDSFGFSFSTPAAVGGCPHLTVPAGFVSGLPVGLSFVGRPWSEGGLLGLGHAFEQAAKARRAPRFRPSAG